METVWIVIGFTIVNVAWIIALNMVLMAPWAAKLFLPVPNRPTQEP